MDELSNRVPKVVAWELALFSHIFLASRKRTRSAKHARRGKARTINACCAGQKNAKKIAPVLQDTNFVTVIYCKEVICLYILVYG